MRDVDIHIGDVLRIRQWDDMAREFGTDALGNIPIHHKNTNFTLPMRSLCGRILTVSNKFMGSLGYGYLFEESISAWFICSDMLEPYNENEFITATDEEISDFLLQMR